MILIVLVINLKVVIGWLCVFVFCFFVFNDCCFVVVVFGGFITFLIILISIRIWQ